MSGLAQQRSEMRFFGAEAYISGLKHAKRRVPKAEFAQMDACRIPFVEEFDIIGAFDVLEHIMDDRKALQETHKALVPQGGIIITVPQHPWFWSKTDEISGHQRRYTRTELREKVESAGFDILLMTSFVSLLFPFMLTSRWIGMFIKNKNKSIPLSGIRLPKYVNTIFKNICALELKLFKLNIRFPFGGSLACVARKKDDAVMI